MPDERTESRSMRDDASDIVGVSVFVLLLVNVGLNAAVTWAVENGGPRGGILEWAQFLAVYLRTFAISATLTLALAVYAVPRMYGRRVPWIVPLLVIVMGAVLAGQANDVSWNPVSELEWESPAVALFKLTATALLVFAWLYGSDFLSGAITGIGGGLIAIAVTYRRISEGRDGTGLQPDPPRPHSEPWIGGVIMLIVTVAALALIIHADLPEPVSR